MNQKLQSMTCTASSSLQNNSRSNVVAACCFLVLSSSSHSVDCAEVNAGMSPRTLFPRRHTEEMHSHDHINDRYAMDHVYRTELRLLVCHEEVLKNELNSDRFRTGATSCCANGIGDRCTEEISTGREFSTISSHQLIRQSLRSFIDSGVALLHSALTGTSEEGATIIIDSKRAINSSLSFTFIIIKASSSP